ncbi:hypothetical protein MHYP_G00308920 [Metynnis hypsauchen]
MIMRRQARVVSSPASWAMRFFAVHNTALMGAGQFQPPSEALVAGVAREHWTGKEYNLVLHSFHILLRCVMGMDCTVQLIADTNYDFQMISTEQEHADLTSVPDSLWAKSKHDVGLIKGCPELTEEDGEPHDCVALVDKVCSPRQDLKEEPLQNAHLELRHTNSSHCPRETCMEAR